MNTLLEEYQNRNLTSAESEACRRNWMKHNMPWAIVPLYPNGRYGLVHLNGMTCLRECCSIELSYVQGQKTTFSADVVLNQIIDDLLFVSSHLGADALNHFQTLLYDFDNNPEQSYHTTFLPFAISKFNSVDSRNRHFLVEFAKRIMTMKDAELALGIIRLLEMAELTQSSEEKLNQQQQQQQSCNLQSRYVSNVCNQMIQFRYEISRDLFLLLSILSQSLSNVVLAEDIQKLIDAVKCRRLFDTMKAYHKLYWLSTQSVQVRNKGHMPFIEFFYTGPLKMSHSPDRVVLDLWFWRNIDGKKQLLNIAQSLHECSDDLDLLKQFCDKFIKEVPHLHHYLALCELRRTPSNLELARDHFIEAGMVISLDKENISQLSRIILESISSQNKQTLVCESVHHSLFQYYKFVSHRMHHDIDLAIEFSNMALLSVADSPAYLQEDTAIMYSSLFHLYMKKEEPEYEKAYVMISLNPDIPRKVSDLTHFTIRLCNAGKHIHDYPLNELVQDAEQCLLDLARLSEIRDTKYYKSLYSLHTRRLKFDKAAACMYENAQRIEFELDKLD